MDELRRPAQPKKRQFGPAGEKPPRCEAPSASRQLRLFRSAFIPRGSHQMSRATMDAAGGAGRSRNDSAGLPGYGWEFRFGWLRRVLLVDDLRDFEQQRAGGVGGDRVGEPVLHPIEGADAVLLAVPEPRLADDIGHKIITAEPLRCSK